MNKNPKSDFLDKSKKEEMEIMRVWRKTLIKIRDDELVVGDQIKVKLRDGRKYFMTAVERQGDKMLVVFDECVAEKTLVNTERECAWETCDLRKWLNTEFYALLPAKITRRIVPDESSDLVTLLSSEQLFGVDAEGNDCSGQIEYFKSEKNRVAEFEGETCWYWTKTPHASNSNNARSVRTDGTLNYTSAYYGYRGVRPACLIQLRPEGGPDSSDMESLTD